MRSLIAISCAILILLGIVCAQTSGAAADEVVTLASARYLVGELQQRLARERGEPLIRAPAETIKGYLSRPAGAGPFPAVVYLHGCGGLSEQRRTAASEQFTRWGYVTLVVDSFATRGIEHACLGEPIGAREADAMGALIYLSKLAFVDPRRIAVIGYSQGGMVALEAASFHPFDIFEMPSGLKYKAAVAFYPLCSAAEDQVTIPTIVFIGELDDWSSVKRCEDWMARRAGKGAPVKLVVYPEAYHSFDSPNLRVAVRYFGHWLKYDADATERSTAEMHDFLAAQLGP
jgi:dienelactone hydrolase